MLNLLILDKKWLIKIYSLIDKVLDITLYWYAI